MEFQNKIIKFITIFIHMGILNLYWSGIQNNLKTLFSLLLSVGKINAKIFQCERLLQKSFGGKDYYKNFSVGKIITKIFQWERLLQK